MVTRGRLHTQLLGQLAVAGAYLACAWLCLNVVVINGQVSPVWFSAGVGLWAVHTWGRRYAAGVFVGEVAATLLAGTPIGFSLMVGLGNAGEVLLASALLTRLSFHADLGKVGDVGAMLAASAAGALFSALFGTAGMIGFGLAPPETAWTVLGVWLLGNSMGTLLLSPVLFTLSVPRSAGVGHARLLERVGLVALLVGTSAFVFGDVMPKDKTLYAQAFLLFPPVVWAALRTGPRGAALATLIVSVVAIWGTVIGRGPFVEQVVVEGLIVLQFFIALLGTMALLLAGSFAERQAASARLVLSERLASVGLVAAGIGHEIKNPLAFVTTNLELIGREVGRLRRGGEHALVDVERLDAALADARHGTERVADIVQSLRLLSREAAQERTVVRLDALVPLILPLVRHELRGRVNLELSLGAVPPVLGNEARLGQVVLNLALNAIQAIPAGRQGSIRLSTGTDAQGRALIEVTDDGTGIKRENLRRLFEPFFTTRPHGVGTGLGLFISSEIVREHGGEITVESLPGVKTIFRIHLPAAPPSVEVAAPVVSALRSASAFVSAPERGLDPYSASLVAATVVAAVRARSPRRAKVLIVDDEVRLNTSMRLLLEPWHEVSASTSGADALQRMLGGERFDVVLCDLQMPEVTGMDLYARLQQSAPEQADRMVFLTGGAHTDEARAFVGSVVNPVLEKPVAPEHLLDTVERVAR